MVSGRRGQSCALAGMLAPDSASMRRPRLKRFAIMPATLLRQRQNRQPGAAFARDREPGQFAGQGIELCYYCVCGGTEPWAPWKKSTGAGI
jgi:hypothetical protein